MAHACGCGAGCKSNASPITADRTVEEISHQSPEALAILKAKGINHCCGAHLTLREAAAAAGMPLDDLLKALGTLEGETGMRAETMPPLALEGLDAERRLDLDVREDLRRGEEPLSRIMAAVSGLGPGGVLVLHAIFEPLPLYRVLGRRGFAHWTEQHGPDDWSVWFYPDLVVLDVRGLEPPEPMVRVLEALDCLAPGQRLEVRHSRHPTLLYPQLEDRGFVHETDEPESGLVRIVIRQGTETAG